MPERYYYGDQKIVIPRSAEVSRAFRPHLNEDVAIFKRDVQTALDEIEPWMEGEDPIHTFDLSKSIGARIVRLSQDEEPFWGIYDYHKAREPDLSPFIIVDPGDPRKSTDIATLELRGTPEKPMLTRVHPGEYSLPLPWMQSANQAPGGKAECIEFWNQHAYVYKSDASDIQTNAPEWYKS